MSGSKIYSIVAQDAYRLSTKQVHDSIDLILTDPPYGIAEEPKEFPTSYPVEQSRLTTAKAPWDTDFRFSDALSKQFYRILRPGGTLIVWYDFWKMESLKLTLTCAGFRSPRLIIWRKTNPIPVNSSSHYLHNAKQFALVTVKGHNPTFHSKYDDGIYNYPSQNRKTIGIEHPTQKSLGLFRELVRKHTSPGDLVFDPFLGSGITLFAALEEGRRFIGGDLQESYISLIGTRLRTRTTNTVK